MNKTKSTNRSITWPLWPSVWLLALSCVAHAQFYAVMDLGNFGGTNSMAYGINNHEQIVGTSQTIMGSYRAFMFDRGSMMDLGTLGGSNSWAYGINDNGWMVGEAELPGTNSHAFVCTNAWMNPLLMDLGTLGGSNSAAWMINLRGDIVGWSMMAGSNHHAFFMTNFSLGNMMDLGTAGGTSGEAYGINSNRMVVGGAILSNASAVPIMSTNALFGSAGMMTMGMGGMGALGGQSWAVNALGDISGQAMMPGGGYHAFVSPGGGMMGRVDIDLGTLGGTNSIAYCLNDAGTAVGTAQTTNAMPHAFVMTNALTGMGNMADLDQLIPTNSGWELMVARGINASGQIVGWGMHAGHTNAFLLTPVSAPGMMPSVPSPQIVGLGTPVTLSMPMSGNEPLDFQWMHDGVTISGATNATLVLAGMNYGTFGQYTMTARNAVGMVANSSVAVSMFTMMLTDGSPQLVIAAPSGSRFRIDYSDLLGPGANWQSMTNFTVMSGMSQVRAMPPASPNGRYYRAAMLP